MYETRPWLKNYLKGIPANIDEDKYSNIVQFLEDVYKTHSGKAFICMGTSLTFSQVDRLSDQFGAYLQLRGCKPGDKFAFMMPNILQYPIAVFGAIKAGLVLVNVNPLYTAHEMKHQLTDAEATGILILENFAHKLETILPETNVEIALTTSIGEMLSFPKNMITNFVVRNMKKMVPKFTIPNSVNFKKALQDGKNHKLIKHYANKDDVAALQYTGGTTGISKGTMLTHNNLLANMLQIQSIFCPNFKDGVNEVILSPLPLYHIFAFSVNLMALHSLGSANVLVVNPRDLNSVIKEFKNNDITMMTGVNTLFNALNNNPDFQKLDFKLKCSLGGGMAIQSTVATRWKEITNSPLVEGYGLTETSPVATVNPVDGSGELGSIGLPVPSTDVKIIDENGDPVPVGKRGEICIKGPQVMKGYYKRPEETEKVLKDGWLLTGDIAVMDEQGFFKIVDRKKDMILVSGFNVYPNEIEDVIIKHPKVLEVCAVGVPDAHSTEAVKVFIVKKDASLTEEDLKSHYEQSLTGYKKPKYIEFRKELPKSNVGKILRRVLRDEILK